MTELLTPRIGTMTEMREPHKVLERSGGKPVAVLKNSALVGYFVPAAAVHKTESRVASHDEILEHLKESRKRVQPVLEYLKDK